MRVQVCCSHDMQKFGINTSHSPLPTTEYCRWASQHLRILFFGWVPCNKDNRILGVPLFVNMSGNHFIAGVGGGFLTRGALSDPET